MCDSISLIVALALFQDIGSQVFRIDYPKMSNATQRVPAPFVFAASQYFEGPDGQWSSFVVRAGTPEQSFRVLPSTVTSEIFVPMSGACKAGTPVR